MNMDDIRSVFAISKEARQIALRDAIAIAENIKLNGVGEVYEEEIHNRAINCVITDIRRFLED